MLSIKRIPYCFKSNTSFHLKQDITAKPKKLFLAIPGTKTRKSSLIYELAHGVQKGTPEYFHHVYNLEGSWKARSERVGI